MLGLVAVVVLVVGGWVVWSAVAPKPEPTALEVTRPKNPLEPGVPALEKRITDVAQVRRLYDTALALPSIPIGASYNCPADHGGMYKLVFFNGETKLKTMTLKTSGCEWLAIDTDNLFLPQDVRQTRLGKADFYAIFSSTTGIAVR
ncbi:hypothetical protein KDH_78600 [Dictyobacter sp. S3.2.2.5]|uniref:Uncharacterized protein n=1 Tax=Dictyobacter halimunensis TaxID=3026934 RepID=A0ABQ6G887_9CHLR|nr:hypothetical protein KDH_78600 [Dictyobacter sp. S3.2.2.5]